MGRSIKGGTTVDCPDRKQGVSTAWMCKRVGYKGRYAVKPFVFAWRAIASHATGIVTAPSSLK